MPEARYRLFAAALEMIGATGLDRLARGLLGGRGVILTFHHVRREPLASTDLNRILEITPDFLEAALGQLAALDYEIIPLDDVPARLAGKAAARRFAVLTFDDGYRDNVEHALPVLQRYEAPFTVFVCTGFADGTAPIWWLDLEEAMLARPALNVQLPDGPFVAEGRTPAARIAALRSLYWRLRGQPEVFTRNFIGRLADQAGIDTRARTRRLCLNWEGLRALAREPLVSFGAHSLSHPRLATLDAETARREIAASKAQVEAELGMPVRHFAYPVGDRASAGLREAEFCRIAGFETAVTTRPGLLFSGHAERLHALPRLSVNGLFQTSRQFRALLSGLPTFAFNGLRRVDAP